MGKAKDAEVNEADAEPVKKIVVRESIKFLKCDLTRDEIFQAGQKLADAQQEISAIENEEVAFKQSCKSRKARRT